MTRLLTEGFEMGDSLSLGGGMHVATHFDGYLPRSGSYHARYGSGYFVFPNNISEVFIRYAIMHKAPVYEKIVLKSDTGVILCSFDVPSNILATIKIGTTTVASAPVDLNIGSYWYMMEIHFKLDSVDGIIEVKANGLPLMSFSGNTIFNSNTVFKRINFELNGDPAWAFWDDIAINDTNGSVDNSWCGDGHIIAIKPNANGDVSTLTGSDGNSVDNYLLVNEIPYNGDTSYVSGDAGTYDLYNLESPALGDSGISINRIFIEARGKDSDRGNIAGIIKINNTEYETQNISLSTEYSPNVLPAFLVNPNTNNKWTKTELINLQAGLKMK